MKIAVGSHNSTKLEAVNLAFSLAWPHKTIDVIPQSVTSGVSDQPMSDAEAFEGARNRAINAAKQIESDFSVGLEGGIQKIDGRWFDSGWAVVRNNGQHEGVGTTLRMPVPPSMMQMILGGIELGLACDKTFQMQDTKKGVGFFGMMTNGLLDRAGPYRDAVTAALSIFLHVDLWYPDPMSRTTSH